MLKTFQRLATELKTGNICVEGSESFADYREQLLSWEQCQKSLQSYCEELDFPLEAEEFVASLKTQLSELSHSIDKLCQQGDVLAMLSPYLTGHLKRYGDYIVDFDNLPQPLETAMVIPIEPET